MGSTTGEAVSGRSHKRTEGLIETILAFLIAGESVCSGVPRKKLIWELLTADSRAGCVRFSVANINRGFILVDSCRR